MPVLEAPIRDYSARGHPAFSCRGLVGQLAAGTSQGIAVLANVAGAPANARLVLLEAGLFWGGDSGPITTGLSRCSTAGVGPASTIVPDVDNSFDAASDVVSGRLYTGPFATTQPVEAKKLIGYTGGAAAGAVGNGYVWTFPDGLVGKPGAGAGFVLVAADASNNLLTGAEVYFVWEEHGT